MGIRLPYERIQIRKKNRESTEILVRMEEYLKSKNKK